MITTPRFRPNYTAVTLPGGAVLLLTETLPTSLTGALYQQVCPLIDGHRTTDEIVARLRERVQPAEVYYTLGELERRGFIEDASQDVPPAEAAYWYALGLEPAEAQRRIQANPVQVVPIGNADPGPVRDALAATGIVLDDSARFRVVVADDYRNPGIAEIDRIAREQHLPWAMVKPNGVMPWIGPFFDPRVPGCWHCLVDRIRMNYPADTYAERVGPEAPLVTARAMLGSTATAAAGMFATELAKWFARRGETDLINTIVSWQSASLELRRHKLVWRPQCPACGEPAYRDGSAWQREPQPLAFEPRRILQNVDGGHRTTTPDQLLAQYADHVSPILGTVSRLDKVSPPGDPVVHAYAASHNWATNPDSLAFLRETLRSQAGGKGKNDLQAKVGAMAEAFERYSGVYRGDEPRRRARMRDLPGAIHPNDVMLFSESQLANQAAINAQGNSFGMVPFRFDPEAESDWSPIWSPTAQEFRWVPTPLLYYSYSYMVPRDTPNRLSCYADSNGCAAGATLEEAALQAMLELAERDAVATWWYPRVRRPAVAWEEIDDPYLDELRRHLRTIGRDLWVIDISNDIGIPVFAAFSRLLEPNKDGSEQLVVGFGAHLDPTIGVMRAITEVNQFFASLWALGEKDLNKAFDPGAVAWWQTATRENQPYVLPSEEPVRHLQDYPDLVSDNLKDEVETAIRLIESRGLEVLLLDQTRPDTGFPVVKAVVPGMRHFWARLAPGRLYDVPVELGWLDRRLAEDEVNPVPVFF